MIVLGVFVVTCYNRLPRFNWSIIESLDNMVLKKIIYTDRCGLLPAKIDFNEPYEPTNSGKIYLLH